MSHVERMLPRVSTSLLLLLVVLAPVLGTGWQAARAQDPAEPEAVPTDTAAPPAEVPPAETLTAKERKQRAKEARIAEYLLRKEEQRARREQRQAAPPQGQGQGQADVGAAVPAATSETATPPKRQSGRRHPLPRDLARAQESVRKAAAGQDPTVQVYLEMIDRQEASPQQLAAFGNFIAETGMLREALAYYQVALRLENKDSLLWTNAGTIHRQLGDRDAATSAYARALSLDPNNALAHYNLGAVLDDQGEYEEAIEEYKLALLLDPTLGDPAYNPQSANNDRLLAVKLMLYRERVGSLGLPLSDVPGGELPPDEASPEMNGTERGN